MSEPALLLQQEFELGHTYTRSTGPVIGRFLTALRECRILGVRGSDGRVLVPPPEFDPTTFAALTEWVEVSAEGEVLSWCWVRQPLAQHRFQHPFAFALIRLDGADAPLLHLIDAGDESRLATGARVCARWAEERCGAITDIDCFEPV